MTFAGAHKVSAKQDLLASFSHTRFNSFERFGVVTKLVKFNILIFCQCDLLYQGKGTRIAGW